MDKIYERGLVSVGFPVYNGSAKIRSALESLLNQTYQTIEITISDNASTDDTEKVCREYAARDPRVRYIRQKENIGLISNTQFVLEEARGEYCMLAADDDWWSPEFVETAKKILDTHLHYGIAHHSVRRVFPNGEVVGEVLYIGARDLTHKSYGQVFSMACNDLPIYLIYGLYRTQVLHSLLRIPFPTCKRYDRVFMCELALATRIYSLPGVLFRKTVYNVPKITRYDAIGIGEAYRDPKHHSKYIWAIINRVARSRSVPLVRKFAILRFAPAFLWRNRIFLRERVPRLYDTAHRFLMPLRHAKRAFRIVGM